MRTSLPPPRPPSSPALAEVEDVRDAHAKRRHGRLQIAAAAHGVISLHSGRARHALCPTSMCIQACIARTAAVRVTKEVTRLGRARRADAAVNAELLRTSSTTRLHSGAPS